MGGGQTLFSDSIADEIALFLGSVDHGNDEGCGSAEAGDGVGAEAGVGAGAEGDAGGGDLEEDGVGSAEPGYEVAAGGLEVVFCGWGWEERDFFVNRWWWWWVLGYGVGHGEPWDIGLSIRARWSFLPWECAVVEWVL